MPSSPVTIKIDIKIVMPLTLPSEYKLDDGEEFVPLERNDKVNPGYFTGEDEPSVEELNGKDLDKVRWWNTTPSINKVLRPIKKGNVTSWEPSPDELKLVIDDSKTCLGKIVVNKAKKKKPKYEDTDPDVKFSDAMKVVRQRVKRST